MTRKISIWAAVLGATLLLLSGLLPFASVNATADAPHVSFWVSYPSAGVTAINADIDGIASGSAQWRQDKSDWTSGDTLIAIDTRADGYGIEAHLSTGRVATTQGHNAPYSDDVAGDLPEDQMYKIKACVVKVTWAYCSTAYTVYS